MPREILEEYKKEYNMKTSEEVFDFQKPAEHQCSNIDKLIKMSRSIEKLSDNVQRLDEDELRDVLNDINWDIRDFEGELESIRKAIEDVRKWGTEWKDLVKYMIQKFEIEIDTLI